PQKILILNCCFHDTCAQNVSSPYNFRRHLEDSHGFVFPDPMKTTRRYSNGKYQFIRHHSDNEDAERHYACPCCTAHVKELADLKNHFVN
ncbi:hypothetical protein CLU79DRAFT_708086, partial [Phycomyces nitens]